MKADSEQLAESVRLSASESQKAWHLLGLLLCIGKPTSLPELASRCNLFSVDPNLIAFLCSIPTSPISLTYNNFVTLSLAGLSAFVAYVARNFSLYGASASPPFQCRDFRRSWLGKRRRAVTFTDDEDERALTPSLKRIREFCMKVYYIKDDASRNIQQSHLSVMVNQCMLKPFSLAESSARHLTCQSTEIENFEAKVDTNILGQGRVGSELIGSEHETELALPTRVFNHEIDIVQNSNNSPIFIPKQVQNSSIPPVEANVSAGSKATDVRIFNNVATTEDIRKENLTDLASAERGTEYLPPSFGTYVSDMPPETDCKAIKMVNLNHQIPSPNEELPTARAGSTARGSASSVNVGSLNSPQHFQLSIVLPVEVAKSRAGSKATNNRVTNHEATIEDSNKRQLIDLGSAEQGTEDLSRVFNFSLSNLSPESDSKSISKVNLDCQMPSQNERPPIPQAVSTSTSPAPAVNISYIYNAPHVEQSIISPVKAENISSRSKAKNETAIDDGRKELSNDLCGAKRGAEDIPPSFTMFLSDMPPETESKSINKVHFNHQMPSLYEDAPTMQAGSTKLCPAPELSFLKKQWPKPSAMMLNDQSDVLVAPELPELSKFLWHHKPGNTPKEKRHYKGDKQKRSIPTVQKLNQEKDIRIKERKVNSPSVVSKDQPKPKELPKFDSYIVEEEEGSGGYGTVYRACRKKDGTLVAIKCPHANAHRHHVSNELRMLERFGGKNFIIKFEGCFKSENSECFVLEHVEHDRPEVLKKEIDVFQLQWYGYCMFRALASLHKQGIVHRDVKPGNFLFSRKTSKGYLIDFNLAMDLYEKYSTTDKSMLGHEVGFHPLNIPGAKPAIPKTISKFPSAKPLEAVKPEALKGFKLTLEPKNKKKAVGQKKAYNDLNSWNKINSQGADGSVITSVRDVSTRTPSAEKLREPLPCQGRKELLSLLQEAMQKPKHEALQVQAPMRRRVAASPGKMDWQLLYLTPMPLCSTAMATAGAGLMKIKGAGKRKREGPSAGTKGFRAPEVLLRSLHQGPKVDMWSAGVTLLYLIIGKTPFFGDPEQNMKDIAKLRGSEDLWEVAKLHNRESSFPEYSTPVSLREWCEANTKRRDFLEVIPSSLFDLVDKCLTVNPRLRISAEDALKHEFFASIHEDLRKQRSLRQGRRINTSVNVSIEQA